MTGESTRHAQRVGSSIGPVGGDKGPVNGFNGPVDGDKGPVGGDKGPMDGVNGPAGGSVDGFAVRIEVVADPPGRELTEDLACGRRPRGGGDCLARS